jgi:hypothetical protein
MAVVALLYCGRIVCHERAILAAHPSLGSALPVSCRARNAPAHPVAASAHGRAVTDRQPALERRQHQARGQVRRLRSVRAGG